MALRDAVRSRRFLLGLVCGALLVFGGAYAINETNLADRLVSPLLLDDSSASADAIVVLGGGVIGDCVPNVNSLRRAIAAARLYRERRAPIMVITGGAASEGCPVADSIMNIAAEMGVPDERMIAERRSQSTYENAALSAPVLRAQGAARVLLVTDRLHMRRAKGVFEHFGFAVEPVAVPIYEGHPDNVSMLTAGAREAAALSYYRFRGWTQPMTNTQAAVTPAAGAALPRSQVSHPGGPLVILGASYAGNWPITELAGGIPVVNNGVAGQRTFQFLDRFDQDVTARQPRAVLLWGFINNLFSSDNLDETATAIRADYTQLIARAKAAGIEPILATEITVRRHDTWLDTMRGAVGRLRGKQSYHDRINDYVMKINQWLTEEGRRQSLLVLDFQGALADSSGRRKLQFATEDGSHVTPAGYETLSLYARPILARHFSAPPASPQ
jgi:uncharacterized SAM-binding protein YcdF (DUF218 family)/lysophospholipase L1-like esterase